MINAKDTLSQYNKIKAKLKVETVKLTEEKRTKAKEVVGALSYKKPEEAEAE
jgi:hypothetical protein